MKNNCKFLVSLFASCCLFVVNATAQVTDTLQGRHLPLISKAIDQPIQRHKWEINVDVIPLLKLQSSDNWAYPYLIKRNIIRANNPGAIRFMVTPYFLGKNQSFFGDTSITYANPIGSFFRTAAILGYEWQKIRGRFVFFYGADIGWRTEISKFRDEKAKKMMRMALLSQANSVLNPFKMQ